MSGNSQTQTSLSVGESASRHLLLNLPTMSWIDKVEMAGSMDDLMTSYSIKGESFFLILRCLMRRLRLR